MGIKKGEMEEIFIKYLWTIKKISPYLIHPPIPFSYTYMRVELLAAYDRFVDIGKFI